MTERQVLPQRRHVETFEIRHGNARDVFIVSVGYFPSLNENLHAGGPAEVFVSGTKAGSMVEAVARDGAVLLSIALQYGVPLDTIKHSITREQDGAPSTIMGAIVDRLATGLVETATAAKPSWRDALKERVRQAVIEEVGSHP
jgi:ribonucleoside-diphosphate reductase alpha chain